MRLPHCKWPIVAKKKRKRKCISTFRFIGCKVQKDLMIVMDRYFPVDTRRKLNVHKTSEDVQNIFWSLMYIQFWSIFKNTQVHFREMCDYCMSCSLINSKIRNSVPSTCCCKQKLHIALNLSLERPIVPAEPHHDLPWWSSFKNDELTLTPEHGFMSDLKHKMIISIGKEKIEKKS